VEAAAPLQARLPLAHALLDLCDADAALDRPRRRPLAGDPLVVELAAEAALEDDLDGAVGVGAGRAAQVLVDRFRRPLAVGDGVDRDARAEGGVAPRVDAGGGGGERPRVDLDL